MKEWFNCRVSSVEQAVTKTVAHDQILTECFRVNGVWYDKETDINGTAW